MERVEKRAFFWAYFVVSFVASALLVLCLLTVNTKAADDEAYNGKAVFAVNNSAYGTISYLDWENGRDLCEDAFEKRDFAVFDRLGDSQYYVNFGHNVLKACANTGYHFVRWERDSQTIATAPQRVDQWSIEWLRIEDDKPTYYCAVFAKDGDEDPAEGACGTDQTRQVNVRVNDTENAYLAQGDCSGEHRSKFDIDEESVMDFTTGVVACTDNGANYRFAGWRMGYDEGYYSTDANFAIPATIWDDLGKNVITLTAVYEEIPKRVILKNTDVYGQMAKYNPNCTGSEEAEILLNEAEISYTVMYACDNIDSEFLGWQIEGEESYYTQTKELRISSDIWERYDRAEVVISPIFKGRVRKTGTMSVSNFDAGFITSGDCNNAPDVLETIQLTSVMRQQWTRGVNDQIPYLSMEGYSVCARHGWTYKNIERSPSADFSTIDTITTNQYTLNQDEIFNMSVLNEAYYRANFVRARVLISNPDAGKMVLYSDECASWAAGTEEAALRVVNNGGELSITSDNLSLTVCEDNYAYKFVGWYNNGNLISVSTSLPSDEVLNRMTYDATGTADLIATFEPVNMELPTTGSSAMPKIMFGGISFVLIPSMGMIVRVKRQGERECNALK